MRTVLVQTHLGHLHSWALKPLWGRAENSHKGKETQAWGKSMRAIIDESFFPFAFFFLAQNSPFIQVFSSTLERSFIIFFSNKKKCDEVELTDFLASGCTTDLFIIISNIMSASLTQRYNRHMAWWDRCRAFSHPSLDVPEPDCEMAHYYCHNMRSNPKKHSKRCL